MHKLASSTLLALLAACSNSSEPRLIQAPAQERISPDLVTFSDCAAVAETLRENLREEYRSRLYYSVFGIVGSQGPGGDDAFAGPTGTNAEGDGASSGSNNQELGVEEADFVKTDGERFWMLNGGNLESFDVAIPGALDHVSTLPIDGSPRSLLQFDDRVAIFSSIAASELDEGHPLYRQSTSTPPGAIDLDLWPGAHGPRLTYVALVNVTASATPVIERELWLEGDLRAARGVGSSIRFVTWWQAEFPELASYPQLSDHPHDSTTWETAAARASDENDLFIDSLEIEDFLPRVVARTIDGYASLGITNGACQGVAIAEDGRSRAITSILSLDLANDTLRLDAERLIGDVAVVYASEETLLIAEPSNGRWWYMGGPGFGEATNIHRFDISAPGQSSYTGSGRLLGRVESPFQLSEYEGAVRVVSTSGFFGGDSTRVSVFTGESSLDLQGEVDGIAPGERLWASRFDDERGFIVTFEVIDPLFTLDLSDPKNPRVSGELEVPGVSVYVHPLGDDALLAVGRGGDAFGLSGSSQVSLFDISDFAAPTLADFLPLGFQAADDAWDDGWSLIQRDHLAFQYFDPLRMLAVPVAAVANTANGPQYRSLLSLVRVDESGFLVHHGEIEHSDFFNGPAHKAWGVPKIERSFFLGDFVYAFSQAGATAHHVATLELTASVSLAD